MDASDALTQLGGVARPRDLLRLTTRRQLRTAVQHDKIRRTGQGRYAFAHTEKALVIAAKLGGMASHASAAQLRGWEIAFASPVASITVPRNRTVGKVNGTDVYWADLSNESGLVTSPLRTVVDCARRLPFAGALSIADSALRHGDVDADGLVEAASQITGKGAARARRVAKHASALAANPFESTLRAIALDAGLEVVPQLPVPVADTVIHPDVVSPLLSLVLEADSWEWHGGRRAHERDCWRYTMLVVNGWTVLRFTWQQVMLNPGFVRACILATVGGQKAGQTAANHRV